MNSLVELQVYSDNSCMVPIVGNRSEDLDEILPAELDTEETPHIDPELRPLRVDQFHDFCNIFSDRVEIEARISNADRFNHLMEQLRRVYNDGIRRLKEGITDGELPCSVMRERAGETIALVNRLYSQSTEEFLSSYRLMILVVVWNLYLIYEVYTALVVQDCIPYALFNDDVDEDTSYLQKKYLSQVKRSVRNAISQDKNHKFYGIHHEIQVEKYYVKELRKTVDRMLSDEKLPFAFRSERTGWEPLDSEPKFVAGLITLNGKYGEIRHDPLVEKYIKLVHLVMPFSVKHAGDIRRAIKRAKNRVRFMQGPYIHDRTGCCK